MPDSSAAMTPLKYIARLLAARARKDALLEGAQRLRRTDAFPWELNGLRKAAAELEYLAGAPAMIQGHTHTTGTVDAGVVAAVAEGRCSCGGRVIPTGRNSAACERTVRRLARGGVQGTASA